MRRYTRTRVTFFQTVQNLCLPLWPVFSDLRPGGTLGAEPFLGLGGVASATPKGLSHVPTWGARLVLFRPSSRDSRVWGN